MDIDRFYWQIYRDTLSAIKQVVERNILDRPQQNPEVILSATDFLLLLERVRILVGRHRSATKPSLTPLGSPIEVVEIDALLASAMNDPFVLRYIAKMPIQGRFPLLRNSQLDLVRAQTVFPGLHEKATVLESLKALSQSLRSPQFETAPTDPGVDVQKLRRILPPQRLAPIEVDIVNEQLVLTKRQSLPEKADENNVSYAADALVAGGERLIAELSKTNCDSRVLSTFKHLQEKLQLRDNVIQLGLINLTCEMLAKSLEEELPSAVTVVMKAHCRGIDMFLAQFPDWNNFLQNAHLSNLTDLDVLQIDSGAKLLARQLQDQKDFVDPEIPQTLLRISELLRSPGQSAKRAAFAMVRSIENIVSRIFYYATELVDQTVQKSISALSTTTSKLVVLSLLGLAVTGAKTLEPIVSRLNELSWLPSAARIVERQLLELQKDN